MKIIEPKHGQEWTPKRSIMSFFSMGKKYDLKINPDGGDYFKKFYFEYSDQGKCYFVDAAWLKQNFTLVSSHDKNEMNAATALYAFAGWLISMKEPITFSEKHWATPAADMVGSFINLNELKGKVDFDQVKTPSDSVIPREIAFRVELGPDAEKISDELVSLIHEYVPSLYRATVITNQLLLSDKFTIRLNEDKE